MPGISCVSSGQRCAVERSDIEKENDHKDLCTFGNAANLVATLRPKRNAKLHSLKGDKLLTVPPSRPVKARMHLVATTELRYCHSSSTYV